MYIVIGGINNIHKVDSKTHRGKIVPEEHTKCKYKEYGIFKISNCFDQKNVLVR